MGMNPSWVHARVMALQEIYDFTMETMGWGKVHRNPAYWLPGQRACTAFRVFVWELLNQSARLEEHLQESILALLQLQHTFGAQDS